MKRVLSAFAACLAATTAVVLGGATPAHAYPCDTTILASPVQISVGITNWAPNYVAARVCVGTNGVAYQEWEVRVHPFGTTGAAACSLSPENFTGVGTNLDSAPGQIGVTGHVGAGVAPRVCDNGNGTYSVTMPVWLCVGAACPVATELASGPNGVVVGTVTVTSGPSGTTGAGLALARTDLWVNGIQVPIGPEAFAAGVGNAAVDPRTGGTPICGPLNLVCVPGSSGVYYNGGDVLAVTMPVLGTTRIALPIGAQCVPVFTIGASAC